MHTSIFLCMCLYTNAFLRSISIVSFCITIDEYMCSSLECYALRVFGKVTTNLFWNTGNINLYEFNHTLVPLFIMFWSMSVFSICKNINKYMYMYCSIEYDPFRVFRKLTIYLFWNAGNNNLYEFTHTKVPPFFMFLLYVFVLVIVNCVLLILTCDLLSCLGACTST